MTGISPTYIHQARRFVQNMKLDGQGIANLCTDTGVTKEEIKEFDETGKLDPEKVMRLWVQVFGHLNSFVAAENLMTDSLGFEPLRE